MTIRRFVQGLILSILATVPGLVSPVQAQATFVKAATGQEGQGFVFKDGRTCWLVTAAHLFRDPIGGEKTGFQLLMEGQPASAGYGRVTMPFWQGLDLAIGAVRFTSGETCRADLATLENAHPSLSGIDPLRIPEVNPAGQLQWTDARLSEFIGHAELLITPVKAFQGRSGGFVFQGDTPVGMIVTQEDDVRHGVVHIEEIAMNFARWRAFRGGGIAPLVVEAAQEAGFDVVVDSSTLTPATVEEAVDSVLVDETPFLFKGDGRIVLKVADETLQVVTRVVIESDGPEAAPKNVRVAVDLSTDGSSFPRDLWGGQFDPAGLYDSGPRSPQRMRRLVLTFWDGWDVGPRRIDRIRLY